VRRAAEGQAAQQRAKVAAEAVSFSQGVQITADDALDM
jgi:hypothetical protein